MSDLAPISARRCGFGTEIRVCWPPLLATCFMQQPCAALPCAALPGGPVLHLHYSRAAAFPEIVPIHLCRAVAPMAGDQPRRRRLFAWLLLGFAAGRLAQSAQPPPPPPSPGYYSMLSSTLAGSGAAGAADGAATTASFASPYAVAIDGASGVAYVADTASNKIRAVTLSSGAVATLAGSGTAGFADSSSGASAEFNQPTGIALDYSTASAGAAFSLIIGAPPRRARSPGPSNSTEAVTPAVFPYF